ncbi:hypothetical protein CPB83DRAFT_817278 [Crepidotus variabilis]|uniref:HMG box domain-containing protein n=1 Tax=Crepidotus variabilis TaxID=179855 RepID=A0A9P6JN30_9AGAR|nr:hypothetical protein CPB83DRAFT_817278 [Crepidotus variabilis]
MSDQLSNFELHRQQLAAGLVAVAESMRNCAELAETFAKIVADTEHSHEAATLLAGASDSLKGKRKVALSPEVGESGKKRKRNVKPKDPNAPKRPASSYILFQNEVRKELKEQHPNLSNSDLLSLISEQWKNMSDEQKETYNQAMKTAKAQYSEEKKAYDNRTPAEIEAANAATEVAKVLKKANAKRGPKPKDTPAISATAAAVTPAAVPARPPPKLDEVSPDSSESSDEEESEEDSRPVVVNSHHLHHESQSSDEEDEEEEIHEPARKKPRSGSTQPAMLQKAKRTSHV